MALKLKKNVKGLEPEYWKIFQCDVKMGFVKIGLYANADSAEELNNFFIYKTYNWANDNPFTIEEMNKENNNPIKIAYTKIKLVDSDLSTAEDC